MDLISPEASHDVGGLSMTQPNTSSCDDDVDNDRYNNGE